MLSNRRRALLLVGCLVLAGCSQPDNSPDGYDAAARENFMEACTGQIVDRATDTTEEVVPLGSEGTCGCIFDYFAENMPYDEFETLDADVEADPTKVPAEVQLALDRCSAGPIAPTSTTAAP